MNDSCPICDHKHFSKKVFQGGQVLYRCEYCGSYLEYDPSENRKPNISIKVVFSPQESLSEMATAWYKEGYKLLNIQEVTDRGHCKMYFVKENV